ncbi:MAG: glycosyltransferase [Frankiales bacterium]|nr:glycosyltransferase [Frankiales bacterium]
MTSPSIALVVDPRDPPPPWRLDLLGGALRALGHPVVLQSGPSLDGADVVHAFGRRAAEEVLSRAAPGTAVVVSLREGSADDLASAVDAVRRAAAVLLRSSALSDRLVRAGVPQARAAVLPVGVDTETFTRRGAMANRTHRHRLVAELAADPAALACAVEAVAADESVELVVLARHDAMRALAEPAEHLRTAARAAGAGDRVVVAWPHDAREKAWWIRSAHAALALDPAPGRPEFVAEAMACGVAVVATPVEAQRDLVVHGVTGLHVREHDTAAVVHALRDLVADDFAVEAFGLAGSDRALGRCSWERVAVETASAYSRCLDSARGGQGSDADDGPEEADESDDEAPPARAEEAVARIA